MRLNEMIEEIDWDRKFEQMNDDTLDELGRENSSWVCRSVEKVDIPDGIYDAVQSGYEMTINGYPTFKTTTGIRGHNFDCKVCVRSGIVVKG